jgi:UDPglucose 6-dehydrogenase
VVEINDYQKHRFASHIVKTLHNTIAKKKIAVLGFAFKKDTNDTRETPAISVCRDLLTEQAEVAVYDPAVTAEDIIKEINLSGHLSVSTTPYSAAQDAHAIVILTEWDEFKTLDFKKLYDSMSKPAYIFDGRNILDLKSLTDIGFKAYGIGR